MPVPPLISVALCTHNGARFLEEQVRSICLQTYPPAEIVISDDNSSDDSIAIVQRTQEQCQRMRPNLSIELRVLENRPALYVTKNFEQAVSACRHELIALSDQDDIWIPDRLERMVAAFRSREKLLLMHSDARLVDGKGHALGETLFQALEITHSELERLHDGRAFDVYLRRNLTTGATTVIRRALLEAAVPFPTEWVHDEWLAIIAAATGEIDVMEAPLIDYRQHGGNQIGAKRDSFAQKVRKALGSRGDTHIKRAIKAERLLERLIALAGKVDPKRIEQVQGKIAHQRFRAHLPRSRVARVLPVVREAMSGRYNLYGRGFLGVTRDFFEQV